MNLSVSVANLLLLVSNLALGAAFLLGVGLLLDAWHRLPSKQPPRQNLPSYREPNP